MNGEFGGYMQGVSMVVGGCCHACRWVTYESHVENFFAEMGY